MGDRVCFLFIFLFSVYFYVFNFSLFFCVLVALVSIWLGCMCLCFYITCVSVLYSVFTYLRVLGYFRSIACYRLILGIMCKWMSRSLIEG